MNLLKPVFRLISTALPLSLLSKGSLHSPVLPYHHVVSDEDLPHIKNLYPYKNQKQFSRDLDWLLLHFKPIHPSDLANFVLEGKDLPDRSFLMSFDDGYREIHDVVAPLLFKKGVPAIFFINPGFIDNRELFYRCKLSLVMERVKSEPSLITELSAVLGKRVNRLDQVMEMIRGIQYPNRQKVDELGTRAGLDFAGFLKTHQPFLTSSQLTALSSQGFTLGGHSLDHPHFRYLTTAEQVNQTLSSLDFLKAFAPDGYSYFAFPHEDRTVGHDYFREMGQKEKNIVFFGTQNAMTELQNHMLHRFNDERPGIPSAKQVKSVLLYQSILRLLKREKVSRNSG